MFLIVHFLECEDSTCRIARSERSCLARSLHRRDKGHVAPASRRLSRGHLALGACVTPARQPPEPALLCRSPERSRGEVEGTAALPSTRGGARHAPSRIIVFDTRSDHADSAASILRSTGCRTASPCRS